MRFIHTADWHLGRLFHEVHLTEDQAHVLDQFVGIVREAKPDVVIVAGDIYDRAVPPPEAVQLLDDVLSRLVLDVKVPVVLIAGNHDSPGRLSFGSRLLSGQRLHVAGSVRHPCRPLVLGDGDGPVAIYSVPYAEPATVRGCLQCPDVTDHDSAMKAVVERIRSAHDTAARSILVAHAFVAGANTCESERPLSVGGAGTVNASHFDGFNYVALGHLHRPQSINGSVKGGTVRYSGSLLKYSFDECDQDKGVYLVDMAADGSCAVETVKLTPRRDVRRIEGLLADLLRGPQDGKSAEDYVHAIVLDPGPLLDAMPRLREKWPNALHLDRAKNEKLASDHDRVDVRKTSDADLFKHFFHHATGEDITANQLAAFVGIVDEISQRDREEAAGGLG